MVCSTDFAAINAEQTEANLLYCAGPAGSQQADLRKRTMPSSQATAKRVKETLQGTGKGQPSLHLSSNVHAINEKARYDVTEPSSLVVCLA